MKVGCPAAVNWNAASRSSGLETEVAVFHLWTVKEGLVVST
jgi:hypothetical protein